MKKAAKKSAKTSAVTLFLFLPCLLFCILGQGQGIGQEYPALFQGYAAINRTLQDRLFSDEGANLFTLGRYIGGNAIGNLMGHYQGNGLNSGYYNGQPNATNMLLWYLAFDGLARDLAQACRAGPPNGTVAQLNEVYKQRLLALCDWPEPQSRNEAVVAALWEATLSSDAPVTEYEAWKDFVLSETYARSNSVTATRGMLKALFLNPYFLLRH